VPIEDLLAWNRLTGEHYGSEDQSIFFYSYSKMQRPTNVLELGTGLGHTALWLAQALKENDAGHVWTVDNGVRWPESLKVIAKQCAQAPDLLRSSPALQDVLGAYSPPRLPVRREHLPDYGEFMERMAATLGLSAHISFLAGELTLADTVPVTAESHPLLAPALERPIDLLYADFDHYPHAILAILVKYLPLMSESSSIFVDSASTYLPSYLALEQTIDQLNRGKLPAIFLAGTTRSQQERLARIVATRRFTHVALPERKDRNQNGLSWIRIEPVSIVPYPLTQMRGLFAAPVSGTAMESFFEGGALPEEQTRMSFLFEQFVRAAYSLTEGELRVLLALLAGRKVDHSEPSQR
jgi:Methyltransferase domain